MRFRRASVVIAFALFFASAWPTPYVGERKENRIFRALSGHGYETPYLFRFGSYDGWPIRMQSALWWFTWLGIGAATGYGVLSFLDPHKRREER